jgi:hypothetical protein
MSLSHWRTSTAVAGGSTVAIVPQTFFGPREDLRAATATQVAGFSFRLRLAPGSAALLASEDYRSAFLLPPASAVGPAPGSRPIDPSAEALEAALGQRQLGYLPKQDTLPQGARPAGAQRDSEREGAAPSLSPPTAPVLEIFADGLACRAHALASPTGLLSTPPLASPLVSVPPASVTSIVFSRSSELNDTAVRGVFGTYSGHHWNGANWGWAQCETRVSPPPSHVRNPIFVRA